MANTYDLGDGITFTATFTVSGANTDPTTVLFKITTPDGVTTTYTYGVDAELVKSATGIYYVDYVTAQSGEHKYRFAGTGVPAATENIFNVKQSYF